MKNTEAERTLFEETIFASSLVSKQGIENMFDSITAHSVMSGSLKNKAQLVHFM